MRELILPTRGRYYCPVLLPWFRFARLDTAAARLRRAAYPCISKRGRGLWLLQWPLRSLLASWRAVRRWGGELERHAGISRWSQLRQVYRCCLLDNVPPHAWYLFRMWTETGQSSGSDYLHEFESQSLLRSINQKMDSTLLNDKRRFDAACRRLGLKAVMNIAVLEADGSEIWAGTRNELPTMDLFIKRPDGICGQDAELWLHDPATGTWQAEGQRLDASALLAHLRVRAADRGRMIQPRLVNHPDLQGFSRTALCTLRMVTWRLPGQASEFLQGCLRMPCGDTVVDNFTPGGVAAAITGDGTLLAGSRRFVGDPVDEHPDTGARIRGARIPYWEAACALVRTAHDRLELAGAIGWDVAITAAGPVLVEGNPVWGTDLMQVAAQAPLASGRLPEIVARFQAMSAASAASTAG